MCLAVLRKPSCASIVTLYVPDLCGLPLEHPSLRVETHPDGHTPARTVKVTGDTVPLALTVARYDRPTLAGASRFVASASFG